MSILHTQKLFSMPVNTFLLVRNILSTKKRGTSSPCISSKQITQAKIINITVIFKK